MSSGGAPDEVSLLAALLEGDEAAFASVVDEWSPAMLRLARCHVSTDASAQEVVQEAWLGMLKGLDVFEGRCQLRTWVMRIVANIAKSRGQREQRSAPFDMSSSSEDGPTVDPGRFRPVGEPYAGGWWAFPQPWPAHPESEVVHKEMRGMVQRAISSLPSAQRAVMVMRDIGGYDAPEVCEVLDITSANQRVLLHRARASVRSQLEGYFLSTVP